MSNYILLDSKNDNRWLKNKNTVLTFADEEEGKADALLKFSSTFEDPWKFENYHNILANIEYLKF